MAFDGQGSDLPLFYGGIPQLQGHMCMTHLLRKLLKKNFFTLLNFTFFMKKFPDIYDIQIELEQSKVGQNEMLR